MTLEKPAATLAIIVLQLYYKKIIFKNSNLCIDTDTVLS